jgi:hypothetical protein
MKEPVATPRQAILFAGHLVDAPGREPPRFPESAVDEARRRIDAVLETLTADASDLAYTQGACGGDVLFTEACQARGVPVQWLQPFDEPEFVARSVAIRGDAWLARYAAARARLDRPIRVLPSHVLAGGDPFERCNHWLLESAMAHGAERLRLVVLWSGEAPDGPGGTEHLAGLAQGLDGPTYWIDPREWIKSPT